MLSSHCYLINVELTGTLVPLLSNGHVDPYLANLYSEYLMPVWHGH